MWQTPTRFHFICAGERLNVHKVAAELCRTVSCGDGFKCQSSFYLWGNKLHITPQTKLLTRCHTTAQIQLWCSMSPLSGTKQTRGLHLRIDMKRMQHFVFRWRIGREEFQDTTAGALWIRIIIFPSSESSFTAVNTLLSGLMWLIFGLFSTQAFVAWFTAQKALWCHSAFYIATSSVQSWRHALLCFLLLLTEETHNHKKTLTHAPAMSPWALGFVPAASALRMSNAVTVNPQSPRLGFICWQWLLLRIKEGHAGKTGSIITTQCTLGTVISPGALKDPTKHLKGAGKNVTEDGGTAVPEHIRGTSILLSAECIMFHVYRVCNEKKTSSVGRWPH